MSVPEAVRSWWSAFQERRAKVRFEIQWDHSGLVLAALPQKRQDPLRLAWEEISQVYAYKRDCITVDQIRLVLGNDSNQVWMEVSEDDVGFKALLSELPRFLPCFPNLYDWWDSVVHPAFETNWTPIYQRRVPRE